MAEKLMRLIQSVTSADNAQLFDLTDRGLLLADGVFDTSRAVGGRIILRHAHFSRLQRDAEALGIQVAPAAIAALAGEVLPSGAAGALRLTITRGPGARGLSGEGATTPTLLARFTPMEMPYPAPATALITSTIRRNPTSPTARHKTLSYTDNIMALREAVATSRDDALLLSPGGHAACATAANLFARFGNRLLTPPVEDGAMPGVLRGWLLENAARAGLTAAEESLTPEQLLKADGLFLTNSLRIFQPVSALDGTPFETGLPEPLVALGAALIAGEFDD